MPGKPPALKLRYLNAAFGLVGVAPEMTRKSIAVVDAWERKHRVRLPAALREWYTVANGLEVLGRFSNEDRPSPLGQIEKTYLVLDRESWDQPPRPEEFVTDDIEPWVEERLQVLEALDAPTFVEFMVENQAVVRWHVPLRLKAGPVPDDPPVYVDNDDQELAKWSVVAPSLSVFLFDWFCEYRYRTQWTFYPHPRRRTAAAEARWPTEAELSRLRRHFSEGPHTPLAGEEKCGWEYRFYEPEGCLRIGRADFEVNPGVVPYWELRAESDEALLRMLRVVWPMSNFAETARPVYLVDEAVEELPTSLGWVKDNGVRDARWHLERGMVLRRQGASSNDEAMLRQAVAELTRAIELDPNRKHAYEERIWAYERLEQSAGTVADYERLIELEDESKRPYLHLRRADLLRGLGRLAAAAADVCAAIRIDPDYSSDYFTQMEHFTTAGREDLARRVAECWRDHPPRNPDYKKRMSDYFAKQGGRRSIRGAGGGGSP